MKILLVDDDRDLVDLLRYAFQREGYRVVFAFDGQSALSVFETEAPDVVVLDIKMPKMTGIEVLRALRARSDIPILMLTAAGEEDRVVAAFEQGADDYVVKPFRPHELRVRIQALLRRTSAPNVGGIKSAKAINLGEVVLDPLTRQVSVGGKTLLLTAKEFELLHYLMVNRDAVLSPSHIISGVWGYDCDAGEDVLKVTVYRLRRKLEPDPTCPKYIVNVPGQGYKFQS